VKGPSPLAEQREACRVERGAALAGRVPKRRRLLAREVSSVVSTPLTHRAKPRYANFTLGVSEPCQKQPVKQLPRGALPRAMPSGRKTAGSSPSAPRSGGAASPRTSRRSFVPKPANPRRSRSSPPRAPTLPPPPSAEPSKKVEKKSDGESTSPSTNSRLMWNVSTADRAQKALGRAARNERDRILTAIRQLAQDPKAGDVKPSPTSGPPSEGASATGGSSSTSASTSSMFTSSRSSGAHPRRTGSDERLSVWIHSTHPTARSVRATDRWQEKLADLRTRTEGSNERAAPLVARTSSASRSRSRASHRPSVSVAERERNA
jgi:hypothetical protein